MAKRKYKVNAEDVRYALRLIDKDMKKYDAVAGTALIGTVGGNRIYLRVEPDQDEWGGCEVVVPYLFTQCAIEEDE